MAGLAVKKDHLSHEMGMHTEGLLGRTQQRFFDLTRDRRRLSLPGRVRCRFQQARRTRLREPRHAADQRQASRTDRSEASALSFSAIPARSIRIAVGILHRLNLHIEGSCGYFACGLLDGPNVTIKGRVGWACGENMMAGTIVIEKNAGSQFGAALRGGDLVCKGIGRRAHRHRSEGRHDHRRRRHRRVLRLHDAARPHGDPRQCRQESRRFHV